MILTDGAAGQAPRQRHPSSEGSDVNIRAVNLTRNSELAARVEIAGSGGDRRKGLLGRKSLPVGEGLWIVPCEAVHTFFMRFAIDLIYLDRKHRVVKTKENVRPWRLSACLRAHSVLELPLGSIHRSQTIPGDILNLQKFS
jgi:uncharacterized protein